MPQDAVESISSQENGIVVHKVVCTVDASGNMDKVVLAKEAGTIMHIYVIKNTIKNRASLVVTFSKTTGEYGSYNEIVGDNYVIEASQFTFIPPGFSGGLRLVIKVGGADNSCTVYITYLRPQVGAKPV